MPAILGPVISQSRPGPAFKAPGERSQPLAVKGPRFSASSAASTTGWRPRAMRKVSERSTRGGSSGADAQARQGPRRRVQEPQAHRRCATAGGAEAREPPRRASRKLQLDRQCLVAGLRDPHRQFGKLVGGKRMAEATVWRWRKAPPEDAISRSAWAAVTSMK